MYITIVWVSTNQSLRTIIFLSFLFSQVAETYAIPGSATYSGTVVPVKETWILWKRIVNFLADTAERWGIWIAATNPMITIFLSWRANNSLEDDINGPLLLMVNYSDFFAATVNFTWWLLIESWGNLSNGDAMQKHKLIIACFQSSKIQVYCLSIKLTWTNQKFGENSNISASCADVLHWITNLVMLRRCFLGDVKQILTDARVERAGREEIIVFAY